MISSAKADTDSGPRVSLVIRLFNILHLNIPVDKVMMLIIPVFSGIRRDLNCIHQEHRSWKAW